MDSAAVVLQQLPSVPSSRYSSSTQLKLSPNSVMLHTPRKIASKFSDQGYLQYYNCGSSRSRVRSVMCGVGAKDKAEKKMRKREKRQLKLLKGLSRDLTAFGKIGFEFDSEVDKENKLMIEESTGLLLANLQKIRTQKKELKKKLKQEKAQLKRNTSSSSSSSSSSESSDSECEQVVINMKTLNPPQETQPISPQSTNIPTPSPSPSGDNKIEVCMGGKCKKLGAATILERLQTVVGIEGAVTGCKCMGKCKSGPNVKIVYGDGNDENDSVRIPSVKCETQTIETASSSKPVPAASDKDDSVRIPSVKCETQTIELASSSKPVHAASDKRIEVCMGGKCKRSGAGAILEKLGTVIGIEGAVTGCKCMGKCKSGPNVKIVNGGGVVDDDSVRIPSMKSSSLCIGVGLEDVEAIAASFLDENHQAYCSFGCVELGTWDLV